MKTRYTIPLALAISWLGFMVHNVADLPPSALIGPETIGPTVVYLILLAWRNKVALIGWGWLHFVGGGLLSVLPLPIWPFDPPQTLYHYSFHALYAACQLPLMLSYRCSGSAGAGDPRSGTPQRKSRSR